MRSVLALDLGTRTGWALWTEPTGKMSGTWRLDKSHPAVPDEPIGGDPRTARLFWRVSGILESPLFRGSILAYEDVQFSLYTLQTQLWSSLRTAALLAGMFSGVSDIKAVPVGTLKKAGAGHGAATKDMMASAYQRRNRGLSFDAKGFLRSPSGRKMDDNEIDALHLLQYVTDNP